MSARQSDSTPPEAAARQSAIDGWVGGAAGDPAHRALATLLENLPGMVYRCRNDPDWTMEFVSGHALELTGYRPEALVDNRTLTYAELIHEDDRTMVWDEVQRALARKAPFQLGYRIVARDGTIKWVRENGSGVFSEDGTLEALEGFIIDVSAERLLEEQLFHAQKMEAVGRFAGGVAHDFNNLIMVIGSYAELALEALGHDHPAHGDIEEMRHAAHRASGLARQLLTLSRRQKLEPRVLSVDRAIQAFRGTLQRLLGEQLDLDLRPGAGAAHIRVDRAQLEQVFMNLTTNARDAMSPGGRLGIETRRVELDEEYARTHPDVRPGRYVLIAVSDTGAGMEPAVYKRLFEPFFTTKPEGLGTGLGLALVYGTVRQSGGHVWVYSEPGRGTVFKLYFPEVTAEPEPAAVVARGRNAQASGSETILVAEDEPPLRALCARVLKRYGYTVLQAGSVAEALLFAERYSGPIHLLLTDLVMPDGTGLELADEVTRQTPLAVLYMSGYSDGTLEREIGGAAYLQKPFSPQDLATRVRQVLDDEGRGGRPKD